MVARTAVRRTIPVRAFVLILATLLAVMAMASAPGGAFAGETVPLIDFRIVKADCDEAPAEGEPPISERLPEGCEYVEGVDFTIEVEGGDTLECTTDADGRCTVQVPSEANVTVTEDESTGTDGYAPLENPIETQAVTEFAGAQFINVPDDKPTDLPDVGSGDAADTRGGAFVGLAAVLAVMSGGLLVGGAYLRRPSSR